MKLFIKKIWCKIWGHKLVVLYDVDKCETVSIARKAPSGNWWAYRWPYGIRPCLLHPDGTVDDSAIYVKKWKQIYPVERMK